MVDGAALIAVADNPALRCGDAQILAEEQTQLAHNNTAVTIPPPRSQRFGGAAGAKTPEGFPRWRMRIATTVKCANGFNGAGVRAAGTRRSALATSVAMALPRSVF